MNEPRTLIPRLALLLCMPLCAVGCCVAGSASAEGLESRARTYGKLIDLLGCSEVPQDHRETIARVLRESEDTAVLQPLIDSLGDTREYGLVVNPSTPDFTKNLRKTVGAECLTLLFTILDVNTRGRFADSMRFAGVSAWTKWLADRQGWALGDLRREIHEMDGSGPLATQSKDP